MERVRTGRQGEMTRSANLPGAHSQESDLTVARGEARGELPRNDPQGENSWKPSFSSRRFGRRFTNSNPPFLKPCDSDGACFVIS